MAHASVPARARARYHRIERRRRQLTCFSTVLVILQTSVGEELGDAFDEVDVIVKRNDCSVVQSLSGKLY